MTEPDDPNLSPYAPQVHDEQRSQQVIGLSQDSQRGLRGKFIESILQLVVQAITGIFLPGPLGSAFTQLTDWADGLFDMIREPLSALVDLLVVILDSIPFIGPPLGDVVEDLAALFGLLKDRDAVQQGSADTANVGLAILNARVNGIIIGGASLYDTFDRDVADIASDPNYDVEYFNGPGTLRLSSSASGIATWDAVGFSDAAFIARDTTMPMTTNIVRLSTVIDNFTYGFAGNQAHVNLAGRMSADRLNYVIASISGDGFVAIGYVVAGVYTQMGGLGSVTTSTGDLWDFEIGTLGDEWQFRLLQNNAERLVRNDLGHASMKDTTPGTLYKWTAFSGDCAIGAGPFGTTYQIGMPNYQVFASADF